MINKLKLCAIAIQFKNASDLPLKIKALRECSLNCPHFRLYHIEDLITCKNSKHKTALSKKLFLLA